MSISEMAMLILRIVYGKNWDDNLDNIKPWLPSLVGFGAFFWLVALVFAVLGWINSNPIPQVYLYVFLYPSTIGVWALYERKRP